MPSATTHPNAARPTIEPEPRRANTLDEWIAASAGGDEKAFHRLYLATSDVLYGVALRILRRSDWAEEVLQESFVSVWRHAAKFDRRKGAAMTWLIRIVRNQAIDWINPSHPDGHERLHGEAIDWLDDSKIAGQGLQDDSDQLQHLDSAREAERVADCVGGLEARQRQGIMLVFFHGLSHSDLARHLQQPLGTVKSWVRRGLKNLRLCLAGQAP